MKSNEIIKETIENASEWLEMTNNPTGFVVGLLANRISKMQDYIEYLEKRLEDVSTHKR